MWISATKRNAIFNRKRLKILHKMAVVSSVSFLTFMCVFVFKTSSLPTHPNVLISPGQLPSDSDSSSSNSPEHPNQNSEPLSRIHRHHRVLQFMSSRDYDREFNNDVPQTETTKANIDVDSVEKSQISNQKESKHSFNSFTKNDDSQVIRMNAENSLDNTNVYEPPHIPLDFIEEYGLKRTNKDIDDFVELNWKNSKENTEESDERNRNVSVDFNRRRNSDDTPKMIDAEKDQNILLDYGRKPIKLTRNAKYRNTSEAPVQRLPQAIIFGIKKSGTRALLEFLRIHPDVEGTGPEPHFFDKNYDKGLEWYRSLMPKTYEGQITVEKTPSYFITKEAPKRILAMNPEVKLILVVRDPVTRAISDYCQSASKRAMPAFEEMAILDQQRGLVNASWSPIRIGIYNKHMEKWLHAFPRKQIHLVDGQKLITEPAKELAKVERFLRLPAFITENHFSLNHFKGSFPCLIRKGRVHCLDEKTKGRAHPNVNQYVIKRLRDFYRPFNAKFYQMVRHDFGW